MSTRWSMRPGHGRPKNRQNKISVEAKNAIALAFEGSGGVEAMIAWVQQNDRNRSVFYTKVSS